MTTQQETSGPQMTWHKKPNSGLCDVCGCGGSLRKGVEHRALTADESRQYGAPYVKRVTVCFGQDYEHFALGHDGKELHQNAGR